jgi:hypothetical protein
MPIFGTPQAGSCGGSKSGFPVRREGVWRCGGSKGRMCVWAHIGRGSNRKSSASPPFEEGRLEEVLSTFERPFFGHRSGHRRSGPDPGLPHLLHLRVTQRSNAPYTESPSRNIRGGAYRTDIDPVAAADVAHVGPHRELAADPRSCRHNLLLAAINRE